MEEASDNYRKALLLTPDKAESHSDFGSSLLELNQIDLAIVLFRQALSLKRDHAETYSNLGAALAKQGKVDEAIASYRQALSLKPNLAEAHYNLGNLLRDQGAIDAAAECYHNAILYKPDYADAHNNLGLLFHKQGKLDEAINSFHTAYLNNAPFAFGMYLHCKICCCNWEDFDDTVHALLADIDAGKPVSAPFVLQAIQSTPAQQKRCAEKSVQEQFPDIPAASNINNKYSHDKIRLGYFSADFHDHPVGKLTAELFERHDRSKFEIFGFSYVEANNDSMRQRLNAAFDHFIDIKNQSDQEIATLARHLEIDIAIDLTGHTSNTRIGIFARHPAPIQVKFLGDPGTTGTPYIDYLVADPTVIPAEHRQHYSEKIAYLPNSYLVNGSHRKMSEHQFTRSEVGLPDAGFVFCGFNMNFKITPNVFDSWCWRLSNSANK